MTGSWATLLREVRRTLAWHRRLVVALLTAATAAVTVSALAPPPPETAAVVAASRDLPPATPIATGDLRLFAFRRPPSPPGPCVSPLPPSGGSPSGPCGPGSR